jgi:hypothetical protein
MMRQEAAAAMVVKFDHRCPYSQAFFKLEQTKSTIWVSLLDHW